MKDGCRVSSTARARRCTSADTARRTTQRPCARRWPAALVDLAGYRGRGELADPFCGSGTIAIEAALAAKGRAPGINRRFAAERWANIPAAVWRAEREAARAREYQGEYRIYAST